MKVRKLLKTVLCGAFAFVLAAFGGALINEAPAKASADTNPIVSLFTPTAADAGYTVSGFGDWKQTTTVEDYADSPSGKVLHQVIDNTESAGGETWPALTLDISVTEEVTDFSGYIVWLEYTGEVYSDSDYWGLFNFRFGNDSNTVGNAKPITFIDANGKINETTTGGWCYHRNNMTAIEGTEFANAYSYAFKGYMVIPAESLTGTANAPAEDRVLQFSHHYKKTITADIKIGNVGYYTDYDAVLNELGRCTYSFVDHDGTVVKTETVKPNTAVVAPEYKNTFSQGNNVYTFVGWSGYTDGMTITSDLTFNASYKTIDFQMVKGASIRTTAGSSGIRFIAEFDENLYNEVSLDDNKQFGMLITKLDYYTQALEANDDLIAGLNSLGDNKFVLITESSKNPVKPYTVVEESKTSYRINGAITNIQYSHADWQWIGVGVVITETDGATEYIYSAHTVENSARTAAFVASSALNDPTGDYDETEKEVLKNYVYQTAAKLSGVSEAEFNGSADKAGYISAYSLSIGDGFDTSMKFNKNVEGKEAYLTIGETKTIEAAVVNENGDALDVACSVSVGETDALEVNGTTVKGLKNGYAEVTITCDLFGYSEKVTVYTGSTDAGNRAESVKGSNEGAQGTSNKQGEIAGRTYYWTQYDRDNGAQLYASYSDISVYYIDYLISQGYKYLRVPFYFDTTRYEELGGTASDVTAPKFVIWMAKQLNGTSEGASKTISVPANEWCYYDMDLNHYRMNFFEYNGAGVNTYGFKTSVSSYYQYLQMKFSCAYGYVHIGNMDFVKSSGLSIDESNDEIAFGENVNLAEWYGVSDSETAVFTVDGVKTNEMTAVKAEHAVTIGANVFTANIGNGTFKDEDGNYVVGDSATWAVSYKTVETVEKTMTVKDGLDVGNVALVDVKDTTESVSLGAYTSGDALKELGFEVTHSYVKRYSDGTVQTAGTVANTERGIFYVTVSATKGAQTFSYDVTLDLYNSTEAVEYESFGHTDSKYAVKAYYAAIKNVAGSLGGNEYSYETLSTKYQTGEMNSSNQELYGMELSFDEYFSLKKYGDHSLDSGGKANLKKVYSYDLETGTSLYTDEDVAKITYLAFDGAKITPSGPLVTSDNTMAYGYDSTINVYVTPRHSKEYYQMYSNSTQVMKTAVAAPFSANATCKSGIIVYPLVSVTSATAATTKKYQYYSGNWQASSMWATNDASEVIAGPQTITPATVATYYDGFANRAFPMLTWDRPQGRGETSQGIGMMKLGSLIF